MKFFGLVLIEGLTGCGKSSLAHFVSRQLEANAIPHTWLHEAEMPHPLRPPEGTPIDEFIRLMPDLYTAFLEKHQHEGKIAVVEACFFNNLIEELFIENIPRHRIIQFGMHMEGVIQSFKPALIYLRRGPVAEALEMNIADRGEGFQDFLIKHTSRTAYANQHDLQGYDGMVAFWEELIAIYEELFERYSIDKLLIENPREDWPAHNNQALDFLGIPHHPEPQISSSEAEKYLGSYTLKPGRESWPVWYDDRLGCLRLNRYILIPDGDDRFLINSHHFVVSFQVDSSGNSIGFTIGGRDIDYLQLVGVRGEKVL
jgi:hypothetical protein